MMVFGVVLLVLAVVLCVIGALAWSGRLPGNSVIGLRVPEVRASKKMWVLAHRIAGPLWFFAGVALAFGGAFAFVGRGWWVLLPIATVLVALFAVGYGASLAARTVARIDAQEKMAQMQGPAPDLDALRNAARAADE